MNDLQVLRWFENCEEPSLDENESICKWCKEAVGECTCIDDWKLLD